MNDRIDKKQVLDAMRLIKQYCNEESGCEFCDFYRSGDCITTFAKQQFAVPQAANTL